MDGLDNAEEMLGTCHMTGGVGGRATREADGTEWGHPGLLQLRLEKLNG